MINVDSNGEKYKNFPRDKGVAFFPTIESMSGNPYWPMLVEELEKKGIFIDYHSPSAFKLKWLFDNRNRIKVLNIHFVQQFYRSKAFFKKLIKVLLFAFNMLMARALGYRIIFTLHNLEPTYQIQPAWLDYSGHWIAANLSDRVIVYCDEARRLLKDRYGRTKAVYYVDHPNVIKFYPNTISKESARQQLNLPLNSMVFVFIGGVRPNKGIEILIKAFLKLKNDNYRLVIAGQVLPPEVYAQSLREIAIGDNRISFHLQHIPDDEIQVYMNAANIIVLPFAKILTSGTANLAMSFGRPIIVPRIGCLPELIEPGAGWLFEPDDPDSLAKIIQFALTCDLNQAGQQAFKKISMFSPERFAEQTLQAYWG